MADRSPDWLAQARGELSAARHLFSGGHWAWCCFTCHQSAEKALKAILERFREPRLGHNLNDLCLGAERHVAVPHSVRQACARLNRLYIPTWYPDAFPSGTPVAQFFEDDACAAITDAEEVLHFVESALGSP